jgi:hypothetical protein
VKSTLLTVIKKLVLDGEPDVARLGLLDDGLEPSTVGSSLGVSVSSGMVTARGREPVVDEQFCVNRIT